MNIIKKKFAYLFAMGVFVLGISSSIPVFAGDRFKFCVNVKN